MRTRAKTISKSANTVEQRCGAAPRIALSGAGIGHNPTVAAGPPIPPRWVQNNEASVLRVKSAPCDGGTSIGLNPAKVQLRRYRWKSRGQKSHPPNFDRSGAPDTQQPASDRKGSRQSEHTSDGLPCSLLTPAPGLERLSTSPFVHTGCIRPTLMEQLVHESSLRLALPPAATSWW